MSVLNSNPFLIASGSPNDPAFPLQRSVRFRDSVSAYFNRTPASAGSRTTWTWSGWIKRGAFYSSNSGPTIFGAGVDGNNFSELRFLSSITDTLDFTYVVGGSAVGTIRTTQVFRDPSAWYHIVIALDTTQATASDRIKLYVNGVRTTSFIATVYPAPNNAQCHVNATNVHYIGRSVEPTYRYMDGYLAEVNFIDGQALTPSSFGGYNAGTNVWEVRKYSGTYGTNGFYLPFTDNTSTTHLGLSTATSPETNTFWTVVGSAAQNTTTKKFGAGSVYFPGSTSRLDGSTTLLSDLNGVDWTIEGWINPTTLAATYIDILGSNSAGQTTSVSIRTGTNWANKISLGDWGTGTVFSSIQSATTLPTNQWTHFAFTKQGTTLRCFINGTLETTITSANTTFPSFTCSLGNRGNGDLPYNGYIDDLRITKGIARYTSSFTAPTTAYTLTGETHPVTMLMDFDSSITVGQRMKIWNPSGISLTSGATYDSMLDVPTNTGPTNANFATLSPIAAFATGNSFTLSNGNLTYTQAVCQNSTHCGSTLALPYGSGLFYYEVNQISKTVVGGDATLPFDLFVKDYASAGSTYTNAYYYMQGSSGAVYNPAGTLLGTFGAIANGDLIMIALDLVNGKLYLGKNGTWFNSGNPAAGTGAITSDLSNYPVFIPAIGNAGGNMTNFQCSINFGQRPFTYTPPSGFKSLNTYNLPEPTIPRGDKYFKQYLYTGNGGGQQIGEIQKPASLFNLDRSLRLRGSNSAHFNRTPTSIGNRKTWTLSTWFKRGALNTAAYSGLFGCTLAGSSFLHVRFEDSVTPHLHIGEWNGTGYNWRVQTNRLFRDTSIWSHLVLVFDSTQTTPANRVLVYIDGVLQTLNTTTYPSPSLDSYVNNTTQHHIGRSTTSGEFFDGYLADMYLIDGQALTPTSFGAFDGNNYWTPKAYTGTYGTNGFHLEFEDYSNNTATTIGKDTSGQGNNWTPTGVVVSPTTSASNDSMVDVPTLTSESVANFATINPLNGAGTALTISAANLNYLQGSSLYGQNVCTLPIRSKTYFEITVGSPVGAGRNMYAGVGSSALASAYSTANYFGTDATAWSLAYSNVTAYINNNGVATAQSGTVAGGDIFMYAVDPANGKIWFGRNGTWYSGDPSAGTGASYTNLPAEVFPVVQAYNSGPHSINFGQRPFTHTPPTGFKSLNSFNVAEMTGDVETPDLVRIKSRSATTAALWFNSVSGTGKYLTGNNSATVEATDVNSIIQFNKNGLLIGNNANINTSAATYIADVWKAGETTQNITVGQYATSPANIPSIASTVRANSISGISVVSYTGNGNAGATVAHGLGTAPKLMIVKHKSGGGLTTQDWDVYHDAVGPTGRLFLNTTAAAQYVTAPWNNTAPTSNVFTVGNGTDVNGINAIYTAYCFAEIPGFSKFGSYISNGSPTDGPFVYTGFRPRWVMIKQRDVIRSWIMYDTTRNTYNVVDKYFFMEGLNNNEQTAALLDINSNGFKLKNNNLNTNTTAGQVYVYVAFAENPFKYALAR